MSAVVKANALQLRKYLYHATITSTVAWRLTVKTVISYDEIMDFINIAEIPVVAGLNVATPNLIAAHDFVAGA